MLTPLKQFFLGIRTYGQALAFSRRHRLWGFYVIPAMLNVLIIGGLLWLGWQYSDLLTEWLWAQARFEVLPEWLLTALNWLIAIVVKLLVLFIFIKTYSTLVLLLLSPVLGMVAEKVQTILLERPEPPFSVSVLLKNVLRGLLLTLRNTGIELLLVLGLGLLGFIVPLIAPVTTALIILTEAYFIGFGMIDLRNEFLGFSARQSRQLIWHRRGLAVGNGLGFLAFLLIPVVGVLMGPVVSVIAANLGIFQLEGQPE